MTSTEDVQGLPPEDRLLLSAVAAVAAADLADDQVLLVLASPPQLARLSRVVHGGPVIEADDAKSVAHVISTPSGRADAVVTLDQGRAAVRAVNRGGVVCLPWAPVDAPSVTELVQREVRLVGVASLDDLMDRFGSEILRCMAG